MKSFLSCLISVIFVLTSCTDDGSTPIGAIYSSGEFTVYPDSVTQGDLKITVKVGETDPGLPKYHSDQPIVDALFALAIQEIQAIPSAENDFDIYLSIAALAPEKASRKLKSELMSTPDGIIIAQPSGAGGSWPITTDRISWAIAIWELYQATGDKSPLAEALRAIENTLNLDMRAAWNDTYNLMKGKNCGSASNYPEWMRPVDVYQSMSLGTNVLFANAFKTRDLICRELSDDKFMPLWSGVDREIANSLNTILWIPAAGFYGQYLYGGLYPIVSTANDNFAQALAIIFGAANREMAKSIIKNTPTAPAGIQPFYPLSHETAGIDNGNGRATIQAFWNIAAAKARNMTAVGQGLASTLYHGALYAAAKGAFPVDTQADLSRIDPSAWNPAGMAAMVLRVIAGMEFTTEGIAFAPIVPASLPGEKSLSQFKYRDATLSIKIYGTGESIKTFSINGTPQTNCFIPGTITGEVNIEIIMDNRPPKKHDVEITETEYMPSTPDARWEYNDLCVIDNYSDGIKYQTFVNGDYRDTYKTDTIQFLPQGGYSTVNIVPVNANGITGFSAPTHQYIDPGQTIIIPASTISDAGTALIQDRSMAKKFVETTVEYNTTLYFNVRVKDGGDYLLDVSYTNGNGPVDSGDKCALRTLYVDGAEAGAVVMPQQGEGKWDAPEFSNMVPIRLNRGMNHLWLKYELDNMNASHNTALIEYVRIIKQ